MKITGSHYSRSISHSTVLRGSCLLYYRRSTTLRVIVCVTFAAVYLQLTVIKEYCIVLYCNLVTLFLTLTQ